MINLREKFRFLKDDKKYANPKTSISMPYINEGKNDQEVIFKIVDFYQCIGKMHKDNLQ